ncbi:MAG: Crp/Fnr family transcriptional regulator [Thermodesulfobacteriota bacterium]
MADSRIRQRVQGCLECISRESSIFSTLDNLHINELEKTITRNIYNKGDILFIEGEKAQGIYCVCSGRLKLSINSSEERVVTVAIASPGDVLGVKALLSGKPHNLTAEVVDQTIMCFIRKDDFLDFLGRNGDVCLRLSEKLADNLYDSYQRMRELTMKKSHARLVDLLLSLCHSQSKPSEEGMIFEININQEELAEEIGTSKRNLNRSLKDLKHKRIIECHRRSIKVIDKVALERLLPTENLF